MRLRLCPQGDGPGMGKKGTVCFAIYKKSGAVVDDTPFFSMLIDGIQAGLPPGALRLRHTLPL